MAQQVEITHQLSPEGVAQFQSLRDDAVRAVAARFHATYAAEYERFGARGREATREDLQFHLEFLRPVLEFGFLQSMVDYLRWTHGVLAARSVPVAHLSLSIEWLAEYFAEHMDVAHGAIVAGALRSARAAYLAAGTTPTATKVLDQSWPEAVPFHNALLAGNQRDARAVMNGCMDRGATLIEVERHLMQPALYRIGEGWHANVVSVAQEHLATAIVQSLMAAGLSRSMPADDNDRRVLLACVAGNHHSVGLQMVSDAFHLSGWHVQFLGANVPERALLQQVIAFKPDLVGMSVTLESQLPALKRFLALLTERLGDARPPVMIGGMAINTVGAAVLRQVGADATAVDASAVVGAATALVDGVAT